MPADPLPAWPALLTVAGCVLLCLGAVCLMPHVRRRCEAGVDVADLLAVAGRHARERRQAAALCDAKVDGFLIGDANGRRAVYRQACSPGLN